jgi:hypothetical protein
MAAPFECLRRFNVSRFYACGVSMASPFLGFMLFADNKKGAENKSAPFNKKIFNLIRFSFSAFSFLP